MVYVSDPTFRGGGLYNHRHAIRAWGASADTWVCGTGAPSPERTLLQNPAAVSGSPPFLTQAWLCARIRQWRCAPEVRWAFRNGRVSRPGVHTEMSRAPWPSLGTSKTIEGRSARGTPPASPSGPAFSVLPRIATSPPMARCVSSDDRSRIVGYLTSAHAMRHDSSPWGRGSACDGITPRPGSDGLRRPLCVRFSHGLAPPTAAKPASDGQGKRCPLLVR